MFQQQRREPIGIPTIRDRMIQAALQLIIEPITVYQKPLSESRMREICSSGLTRGRATALSTRFYRVYWTRFRFFGAFGVFFTGGFVVEDSGIGSWSFLK
jgi:hypothetical protein